MFRLVAALDDSHASSHISTDIPILPLRSALPLQRWSLMSWRRKRVGWRGLMVSPRALGTWYSQCKEEVRVGLSSSQVPVVLLLFSNLWRQEINPLTFASLNNGITDCFLSPIKGGKSNRNTLWAESSLWAVSYQMINNNSSLNSIKS